ncbi:MAG: type II toxin-antitoxin system Phd/YefM family antitoxin [Clostridia bacterium]|nr:type II toxin-antitoxin system Phd/YefM family antitoxin [Clostridia bacterium]MBQ6426879.1 type II toxin-antitoxin system Phd/YefM family antitoxin [Clostridia bacterium]MBR0445262.1 type II toxin-antitoxin system Phd/YefM family antitoxin [Clostridia bacterium]
MEEQIRPSADLRNHYADISKACKESRQPVIITVNGQADTVILSLQDYHQMQAELELLRMLADGESDVSANRVAPIEDTFRNLRTRLLENN